MITPRMLAYQILLHMENNPSPPDRLVRSMLDRHSRMEARDRALLTELVYGTLRWQGRLDWHIDRVSSVRPKKITPAVRILLRLALYQILLLERIPEHAAVNESVKIARATQPPYVAGFVNAVLREAIRRADNWEWPDPGKSPGEYLAVTASYPRWLADRCIREMGFEDAEAFCRACNNVAPMALRVNPARAKTEEVLARLRERGTDAVPSSYLPDAVLVTGLREDVTRTPYYENGAVQIQDEASQMVSLILSPEPGERVLDLCAGFGGKSTHLASIMEDRGEVLSVDQAAWKLEELRKNALRQGIGIIRTVTADVLELLPEQLGRFDRVLLDAPCTGFGTIRRNPDIKWRRHPKDPYRFSGIQDTLLQHAARFVRKGGTLVYATCTVFREEDEDVAERFNASHPGWTPWDATDFLPHGCREMAQGPYFRSWPHRHGTDGFFAARWVRGDEGEPE